MCICLQQRCIRHNANYAPYAKLRFDRRFASLTVTLDWNGVFAIKTRDERCLFYLYVDHNVTATSAGLRAIRLMREFSRARQPLHCDVIVGKPIRLDHWVQYNWSGNIAAFLKSPERRHHTYPACDMRGHARHAGYVRWRRPSNMCCCSSNKWTFTKKMTSQWIRRCNDVVSLPSINQCQWDLRLHSSIIELIIEPICYIIELIIEPICYRQCFLYTLFHVNT